MATPFSQTPLNLNALSPNAVEAELHLSNDGVSGEEGSVCFERICEITSNDERSFGETKSHCPSLSSSLFISLPIQHSEKYFDDIYEYRSKISLATVVGCMMSFMLCVCFLCPSMDCLWHKYHYCPNCKEKSLLPVFMFANQVGLDIFWPAFVPVHDPSRKAYIGIQNMGTTFNRRFEAERLADCAPVVATGASVVMTVAPMLTPVVAPVMAAATVATSITGVMGILGI
ncbi:LPS-induced tumor necrosis factor alpha factor [Cucumis melo var. makuwa]|uniref:LPS-induced tumor necrosis factor alpha factor n=1 Tax=Cucumis melo var. makuwa TaxID=1194695 RepID=A0A5D3DRF6_CUCMM|nr:LPS-induced tumor necrosis factor alpha factor [Cucumis melo var. makuwa]TYK26075.1 LPS-induced tumor necrosis factor alpha factor [Cucumis melo var. makuwa]